MLNMQRRMFESSLKLLMVVDIKVRAAKVFG